MLFIIYGLTLNVGAKVRNYFESKGFKVIKKKISENSGTVVKSYFVERGNNSKEEIDRCDFNYPTNYGVVGFNNSDIFDAIYGKENALLAITSDNVDFFHHIKTGYGAVVPIIATYIPEDVQKQVIDSNPQIDELERAKRMDTGKMASRIILENRDLFDDILIYGGEDSAFNYNSLESQLDTMMNKAIERQKEFLDRNYIQTPYQGSEKYVFLSYSHKDRKMANEILAFLQYNGVRVWYDAGIPIGENWMNVLANKIQNSSALILLSSANSTKSPHVTDEIETAFRYDKKVIRLNLDDAQFDADLEAQFYSLNQSFMQSFKFESKTAIINTLDSLGVVKK